MYKNETNRAGKIRKGQEDTEDERNKRRWHKERNKMREKLKGTHGGGKQKGTRGGGEK